MSKWLRIDTPYIAERFNAFTIPDDRHFLVISSEGVHEVLFAAGKVTIRSDYSLPEGGRNFNGTSINYSGRTEPTLGMFGGAPILVDNSCYVLDVKPPHPPASSNDGVVEIWRPDGELDESLPFEDYSGDWQQATFSTDFQHIVIGTPYTITLYRRK